MTNSGLSETEKPELPECRDLILKKAEADAFLGVLRDQSPLVSEFLGGLRSDLNLVHDEASRRLSGVTATFEKSLLKAEDDLSRSRRRLVVRFSEIRDGKDLSAEDILRLSNEIEGESIFLYERVRVQLDRAFKSIAPARKPILSVLERAAHLLRKRALRLPSSVRLIRFRAQPSRGLDGKTIWETEADHVVSHTCRAKGTVGRLFRYHSIRLSLRRKFLTVKVPLAETLLTYIPDPAEQSRHSLVIRHETLHEETLERLDDLWRGIRFNLEAAMAELGEAAEAEPEAADPSVKGPSDEKVLEAQKLVLDVLDRGIEMLPTVVAPLSGYIQRFPEELDQEFARIREKIQKEIDEVHLFRSRLRMFGHRTWKLLQDRASQWRSILVRGREGLRQDLPFRSILGPLVDMAARMFRQSRGPAEESLLRLTDLPSWAEFDQKRKALPPVYQRLFDINPLKNREFLVGREDEMEDLNTILDRWQEGLACSVAIIGPEGSGKTSILNCFESEYGSDIEMSRQELTDRLRTEEDVIGLFESWFDLPSSEAPRDLNGIIREILSGPRRILLVEGGHNLLFRRIGGKRTAEAFMYVLMATRKWCAWLVAFRKYPWKKMEYYFRISQYFTHQIPALFHDEKELKAALLRRQETSGIPLLFLPREDSVTLRKEEFEQDQESLSKRFFKDLFEATDGNIQAALYYWVLSLRYDGGREVMEVLPIARLDHDVLRKLDRTYLFTLAETINHGGLAVEEHCEIFRMDALRSRLTLNYLYQLKLVNSDGQTDEGLPARYVLNPALFAPVTRVLETMNILY